MNIWNIIYWTADERLDRRKILAVSISSCEKKAWKNSGSNGIRTHDLCNANAVTCDQAFVFSGERESVAARTAWKRKKERLIAGYQCSGLPTELWSQLGAGHIVSS